MKKLLSIAVVCLATLPALALDKVSDEQNAAPDSQNMTPLDKDEQSTLAPSDYGDRDDYRYRDFVCYARDYRGKSFWGRGSNRYQAAQTALWYCYRYGGYGCRVTYCDRRGDYGGGRRGSPRQR
jgi:hypothetical protein